MMPNSSPRLFVPAVLMVAASVVPVAAQTPAQVPEDHATVTSSRPARLAVPDFAADARDAQAAAIGRTIADALWNDLDFEREFVMIPRDAASPTAPDAIVHGTVDVRSGVATVEVRLVPVGQQESLFSRRYTGSTANPRAFAHTIADQIHEQALLFVTR